MFASRSLAEHLARGVVGLGTFAAAMPLAPSHPWALALLPLAFVALRGCPMCWTMGLVETVVAKLRGKDARSSCTDGRCAIEAKR
jgi:hypothetical protein